MALTVVKFQARLGKKFASLVDVNQTGDSCYLSVYFDERGAWWVLFVFEILDRSFYIP